MTRTTISGWTKPTPVVTRLPRNKGENTLSEAPGRIFFLGEDLEFEEEAVASYQREHDFDSLFDFPLQRNIIEVLIMDESNKPPAGRA